MNKFCWLIACFLSLYATAQDKLIVMGKSPDLYIVHTANGKETLQNISIIFGQSVNKLATYNHINPAAALTKGAAVKIPLSKDLIVQQKNDNSAPLYHAIQKGDNLYRLSINYNKVPIAKIKEWNGMKNDVVKDGQLLIVGFMVNAPVAFPEIKSAETKAAASIPERTIIPPAPEVKQSPEVKSSPKEKQVIDVQVPLKAVVPSTNPEKPKDPRVATTATGDFYELEKARKLKDDLKKKQADSLAAIKPETKTVVAEEKITAKPATSKPEDKNEYVPKEGDEGYFASAYADHPKELTQQFHSGDAAIFKTISGWSDRKFYILMNDVAPNTLVRITGTNNKSICAMVLGPLQETKGGGGLLLRLSNSAASALGMSDPKFTVTVTYFE